MKTDCHYYAVTRLTAWTALDVPETGHLAAATCRGDRHAITDGTPCRILARSGRTRVLLELTPADFASPLYGWADRNAIL